jgi:hypothetical protein
MTDITNKKLICLKGLLFLLCGMIASVILLVEHPSLKVAVLLAISVWCFARSYYFAFYVIEHYVDASYKFSGLWSFVLYMVRRKRSEREW